MGQTAEIFIIITIIGGTGLSTLLLSLDEPDSTVVDVVDFSEQADTLEDGRGCDGFIYNEEDSYFVEFDKVTKVNEPTLKGIRGDENISKVVIDHAVCTDSVMIPPGEYDLSIAWDAEKIPYGAGQVLFKLNFPVDEGSARRERVISIAESEKSIEFGMTSGGRELKKNQFLEYCSHVEGDFEYGENNYKKIEVPDDKLYEFSIKDRYIPESMGDSVLVARNIDSGEVKCGNASETEGFNLALTGGAYDMWVSYNVAPNIYLINVKVLEAEPETITVE